MKKVLYFYYTLCTCLFLLSSSIGNAQLAIGQWREHLSYKKGVAIAQSDDKIYCASKSGLFQLNKSDYAIDRLSKISGLSDINISSLRYSFEYKTLIITYQNANIDLLIGGNSIYNISDIKRKIINAKKTINNIYCRKNVAYLSCGFGIVVLDLDKKEITDTYYLGKNSGYLNIRSLTSDDTYLFAATDSGIYRADLNAPNLADYNSWYKLPGIPDGIYNSIANINGKIYTNRSEFLSPPNFFWNRDTIYCFNNNTWTKPIPDSVYSNAPLKSIEVYNNQLVISFAGSIDFYTENGKLTNRLGSFTTSPPLIVEPQQAIIDLANEKTTWIVDNQNGLIKNYDTWGGTVSFLPDGPNTSEAYSLLMNKEDLWVTRGEAGSIWIGVYNRAEAYKFSNEVWSKITRDEILELDSLRDVVSIAIDPSDKEHLFMSTLGKGVAEIKNNKQINLLNETNSALQSRGDASFHWVGSFSMTYDKDENLWMTNCYAINPLVVRKKDGTWQSFNFGGLVTTPTVAQLVINQYNQKWMQLPRGGGMIVYDENGTWATGDDKIKKLSVGVGKGNLPSNEVICITEDKNSEMWIGTDKGLTVFYCAENIFSSQCDAQQIYIQQDGHTQILLETEVVTAIVVDGANRKWIGTQNSGVYLMSADGTNELLHFTSDNSPLLSNEILSIAINSKTGEVFFATNEGIISYKSDATEGNEDYTNAYVFPNPVKPEYEGPIAITGLVENVNVKITDISGALVYETKALGGQAIWYGKNFKGEKSKSGVYMVFCSNEDGSQTFVTKILLIN
jgi:hypothetical protein